MPRIVISPEVRAQAATVAADLSAQGRAVAEAILSGNKLVIAMTMASFGMLVASRAGTLVQSTEGKAAVGEEVFDAITGTDPGAFINIPGLTKEENENAFDALKPFISIGMGRLWDTTVVLPPPVPVPFPTFTAPNS